MIMNDFDPVVQDKPGDPKFPASMSPVLFESGGSKLFGTMFIASGEGSHPVILLLHGFPGNEVNFDLAHFLRRQGFCVLVFHYRGCWGSEGNYSWKNITEDVEAAVNFLKSDFVTEKFRVDKNKIILAGHSMGGFAALYNSIFHDEIKNVISLAGFNSGAFGEILAVNKMIYDYSVQTIQPAIEFVKSISAEKLMDEYIEHKDEWNFLNYIEKLSRKNLLLIGAKYDMIAPLDIHHNPLVEKISAYSKNENSKNNITKGMVESHILESGHSFSDKRIELAKIISKWLTKINFE